MKMINEKIMRIYIWRMYFESPRDAKRTRHRIVAFGRLVGPKLSNYLVLNSLYLYVLLRYCQGTNHLIRVTNSFGSSSAVCIIVMLQRRQRGLSLTTAAATPRRRRRRKTTTRLMSRNRVGNARNIVTIITMIMIFPHYRFEEANWRRLRWCVRSALPDKIVKTLTTQRRISLSPLPEVNKCISPFNHENHIAIIFK